MQGAVAVRVHMRDIIAVIRAHRIRKQWGVALLHTSGAVSYTHLDVYKRQDFLVSLMAPLHRQYKTARTETRWHLLLKIGQMPIQTSASRGYVLFDIKMA